MQLCQQEKQRIFILYFKLLFTKYPQSKLNPTKGSVLTLIKAQNLITEEIRLTKLELSLGKFANPPNLICQSGSWLMTPLHNNRRRSN